MDGKLGDRRWLSINCFDSALVLRRGCRYFERLTRLTRIGSRKDRHPDAANSEHLIKKQRKWHFSDREQLRKEFGGRAMVICRLVCLTTLSSSTISDICLSLGPETARRTKDPGAGSANLENVPEKDLQSSIPVHSWKQLRACLE